MNRKLIKLTESDLRKIVKESVNRLLKEISNISTNTDVTVCSVNDFINICKNFYYNGKTLTLTDENVENLCGEFAFIEIRDSFGRVKVEFPLTRFYQSGDVSKETNDYYDSLYYFKANHENVLRLEYDDTQSFGKKGDGITGGAISLERLNDKYKFNQKGEPRQRSFYFSYPDGKDFDDDIAEQLDNFISKNIEINPNVKFIIHCRAGASRSAGIGIFIAKIKQMIYQDKDYMQKFFKEHMVDDGKSQFDIKIDRKGNASYPHQKEMKKLGARKGWNKEKDDTYLQWYMDDFLDTGLYGDQTEKMRELKKKKQNSKKR